MSHPSTDSPPAVLGEIAALVDDFLSEYVQSTSLPEALREAVAYALFGGGKRLRPCLAVLCCEAVGGRREEALPAAGALELIHAFSLVHDDLPAIDNDELRRGRPTLHVHTGEAMAILAGDAMMAMAFRLLCEHGDDGPVRHRLIHELGSATIAMIAGQVHDTLGGFPEDLDQRGRVHLTHEQKTGALISAACRMGALSGGADRATLEQISAYGRAVGLMFQIVDDLLDVTQSSEHLGKTTGKDEAAGKLTFPGLLGVEESEAEVDRLRQAAVAALRPLGDAGMPLAELCNYLAVRTN